MSLRDSYARLPSRSRILDQARAEAIVAEARPHVLTLLGNDTDVRVAPRLVSCADAQGGSLIPAWPARETDGSVTIAFVDDWGAMLAAWRGLAASTSEGADLADRLLGGGQRVWVGIANDVLQLYVKDPPAGTYSMVRHHALMLVAATLWLGPDAAAQWAEAHSAVARAFLGRLDTSDFWMAVDAAEQGLAGLLEQPVARLPAPAALAWLDATPAMARAYEDFLGAASLGVTALLATVPAADQNGWLGRALADGHSRPDFNRTEIEAWVREYGLGTSGSTAILQSTSGGT